MDDNRKKYLFWTLFIYLILIMCTNVVNFNFINKSVYIPMLHSVTMITSIISCVFGAILVYWIIRETVKSFKEQVMNEVVNNEERNLESYYIGIVLSILVEIGIILHTVGSLFMNVHVLRVIHLCCFL